jgi:hypothetical protein
VLRIHSTILGRVSGENNQAMASFAMGKGDILTQTNHVLCKSFLLQLNSEYRQIARNPQKTKVSRRSEETSGFLGSKRRRTIRYCTLL